MPAPGDPCPPWSAPAVCGIEDSDLLTLSSATFTSLYILFVIIEAPSEPAIQTLTTLTPAAHTLEAHQGILLAALNMPADDILTWRRSDPRIASLPFPTISSLALPKALAPSPNATILIDPHSTIRAIHPTSNPTQALTTLGSIA